jgi:hypothetical protein
MFFYKTVFEHSLLILKELSHLSPLVLEQFNKLNNKNLSLSLN